jgi:ubiquinone biosynthesis protein UbiJ
MSVLPKLRDRQQLTALIRSGELEVEGDIQVVQNFVALAIWRSSIRQSCSRLYRRHRRRRHRKVLHGGASFRAKPQRQQRYAAEVLTEEWRMAPGRWKWHGLRKKPRLLNARLMR